MSESIIKKYEEMIDDDNIKISFPSTVKFTETELDTNHLTSISDIAYIKVKHAYCPECKKELISKFPAMFNPFTQEKQCIHKCTECDKIYNLEYAYPRLTFIDTLGNEVFAHNE